MEAQEEEPSGIQVFLRIRPSDNSSSYIKQDDVDINKVSFHIPKLEDEVVNNSKSSYAFNFYSVLDQKAKQKEVFKTIGVPVIKNALAGYNSTIFAYGQTGSGKTFTITGGPERYEDRGIIPRTISQLFKIIQNNATDGISLSCYVSYLEIYNESGYDLLTNNTVNSFEDIPKVTMLEDEFGYFHFKNLTLHPVATEEEALNLLFQGDTNRAVASTEMNQNSTRSHCIFTMILERRVPGADTVVRSKLNIVDLAGSERVSRTSSEGQTLKEAKYINSSLFFLEMVIIALHEKKKKPNVHIPYRNSMMTSVLRDSLGGNCKTVMIATISPETQHTDESISTCHFAQRVALVKNEASINEEVEPAMVIQRLRAEVKRLRDEVAFLQGKNTDDGSDDEEDAGHLPQHELNELTESVNKYVHDFDERAQLDFCGGITLPKIKAVCSIFKSLIHSNERVERTAKSDDTDESSEEEAANSTTTPSGKTKRHKGNFMHKKKVKADQVRQSPESKPKKVCGVLFCSDQKILNEPNAAFEWFKDRYPGVSALEDNKTALKIKYSEAKSGGKKIEEIRARVTYHKEAIERIRRNHAIDMISQGQSDDYAVTSEEKYHSDAINKEKNVYNDTIEYLRKLKGTIQHQQKAVEKSRTKMQSDFDVWYREMCSREMSALSQGNDKEQPRQPSSPTKVLTPTTVPPQPAVQTEPEFVLPPGIKLTGNKEADDDIIAFFKAKSVLLSRTKKHCNV